MKILFFCLFLVVVALLAVNLLSSGIRYYTVYVCSGFIGAALAAKLTNMAGG